MIKTKKRKKKNKLSVDYVDQLWSKAVKAKYNYRCAICYTTEGLESHHVVHRRQCGVLRNDIKNGICLCKEHHDQAERVDMLLHIFEKVDSDYLADMQRRYKHKATYLMEHGLSESEFRKKRAEELKGVINEN